jgi:hypothetical protein
VVSRRVGQVTFAVSLRTSCRNLNGLKAIVCYRVRVARALGEFKNPNSPLAPNPHSKVSRQAGSIVRGWKKPRRRSENGPAAGGGYVLWSRVKVKAYRLRQNQDARIGCPRKSASAEGLKAHGRLTAAACRVLRQTSGALRRTEGNGRGFAASSRVVLNRKACRRKRLRRMTRRIARVTVKLARLFNRLWRIRRQSAGQPWCCSARNPAPREALNFGLRFAQGSNINSVDESCGKLKARRFGNFSCGKIRFFRGANMACSF